MIMFIYTMITMLVCITNVLLTDDADWYHGYTGTWNKLMGGTSDEMTEMTENTHG